jgi:gliding motility-associated-like protein
LFHAPPYICILPNRTTLLVKTILFLPILLILAITATAQQPNNCTVVAKMTPEGDSVSSTRTVIQFRDASLNATGYKFIFNGIIFPMNQPVNMSLDPGLLTVKLVAYNGSCTDTAVSYYFYAGEFPADTANEKRSYGYSNRELEMAGLVTLNDRGNILFGRKTESSYWSEASRALLLRTTESGCILWARKIPVTNNAASGSTIENVKEAADGNLYVIASSAPGATSLLKLNSAGDITWTRGLKNAAGSFQFPRSIEALPDGGVIIVSTGNPFTSFHVTRLDANGQISWQKNYSLNQWDPGNFKNLLLKDGFLYIGGRFTNWTVFSDNPVICKIDCTNGRSVWTKRYDLATGFMPLGDMVSAGADIVLNIMGSTGNTLRPTIGGIMRLDTSGVILSASLIAEKYVVNTLDHPYVASSSRLTRSGKNFYIVTGGANPLNLQGDGRKTKVIRLDSALQVKWVRQIGGIGAARYYFNAPAANDGSIIGGVAGSAGLNSYYNNGTMLHVTTMDSAGGNPNANCYFWIQDWEVFRPTINVTSLQWSSESIASNIAESRPIPWVADYPEMRFNCPDYVDSCSYLKLTGAASICNISQTYLYKTHKNKTCGQPTSWTVSPGVQTITQTDSTLLVRYSGFGRHVIYGRNRFGCVPVEDSMVVIAASRTPPLYLGNDLQVCPGNTRILHAGNRFIGYEWNDGSRDSVLTISQPGRYWVKVTDSCSNILSDTIDVLLAPPVPVSIGNDRSICANDTIHLTATAGFANYQWSPAYAARANTGRSIIVRPLADTSYRVVAEMSPGCLAYDTVHIRVHSAPLINLGPDKSFCAGDSLVLDAGNGFATYAWSNASASRQITVKSPGSYAVMATSTDGCKAHDTLAVLNVFNLPTPRLDRDSVLCEGSSRLLNAGSGYTQYAWSTGASTQQVTVNALGVYAVMVTDQNGCKGSDTTSIKTLQPKPSLFLPADLTICSYETATLQSSRTYRNYVWSNGSSKPAITVNTPGLYWLEVKDPFGCAGRDSMQVFVNPDCIKGVYVPNVFTPNDDGKNDLFKPLVYGRTLQYSFTIFNRWGAIVFQSANPTQGWDGKWKGLKQDGNAFVWILTYQLENEATRQVKGTVLLLR